MTTLSRDWEIPRKVWVILMSWGVASLAVIVLFSIWIDHNNDQAQQRSMRLKNAQDRAMCQMLDLFLAGPPPAAGEAGDRGRAVIASMTAYETVLRCDSLR